MNEFKLQPATIIYIKPVDILKGSAYIMDHIWEYIDDYGLLHIKRLLLESFGISINEVTKEEIHFTKNKISYIYKLI
jgi:hypothetical protein